MREILIRAGTVAIRARLLDTPTAERIWAALPIYAEARTWGCEVYFGVPFLHRRGRGARGRRGRRDRVLAGGRCHRDRLRPTPVSRDGEIRLAAACNVWAVALDDVRQLKAVHAGEHRHPAGRQLSGYRAPPPRSAAIGWNPCLRRLQWSNTGIAPSRALPAGHALRISAWCPAAVAGRA